MPQVIQHSLCHRTRLLSILQIDTCKFFLTFFLAITVCSEYLQAEKYERCMLTGCLCQLIKSYGSHPWNLEGSLFNACGNTGAVQYQSLRNVFFF